MTWNYRQKTARTMIEALIERAWHLRFAYGPYGIHTPARYGKPGDMIKELPEEERKLLEELSTKDIDHRIDKATGYMGIPKVLGYRSRYSREVEAARSHGDKCKCCKKCNWCRQTCTCID